MHDCRQIRSQFTSYLDGDLRNAERERVNDHLRACEECQAEFAAFREFLLNCDEFLAAPQPSYSFDDLRARMVDIEPLAEVMEFVPRIYISGTIPRFAVSFLLLFLVGGMPGALRHSRDMYQQLRSPLVDYQARVDQRIEETLDRDLAARSDSRERIEIQARESKNA